MGDVLVRPPSRRTDRAAGAIRRHRAVLDDWADRERRALIGQGVAAAAARRRLGRPGCGVQSAGWPPLASRSIAWEWVPAVSAATSTATVGGIGIWATFRAGREGREHAETLARQTAEHTEHMAYDAREHKRKEEAYIEMLQVTGRAGHWASRVYPLMDSDPLAGWSSGPTADHSGPSNRSAWTAQA
jgi:hypothetical protein